MAVFRELARRGQRLTDDECGEILRRELRGVLSVLGDGGYPYGVPIDFWWCEEDGHLYFHSGPSGHKIDALRRCDKASFCVMDQGVREEGGWALDFRSVIVFGRVRFVEDRDRTIQICRGLGWKFTSDEAYIEDEIRRVGDRTLCLELVPEQIVGKIVHEK